MDISKIQDEMNPKLKKRKRESVASYPSGTTMDVNSQATDHLVVDAPPSFPSTLVAPQPDKSISTAQMVQVANMPAWNNTRLTSLIEHMTDMIKRDIGAGPSSYALEGEDAGTTETITPTQSEEVEDA
ncbi:hypothetical protein HAX54_053371 [Datura stramonium]|uniref:Uncharacterized protein n=1 Tax=Datura stramonium TaxID=4076 RepID=A0ABS8T1E0_DATST|nr:hypothetical protein [Datura stramonium]